MMERVDIMQLSEEISTLSEWLNDNEGTLALILFAISAAFAWFSGIINALRRRPRLKISVIPGPTLCVINALGLDDCGRENHRLSISLYLNIANAGSAPTSIGNINIGYRWSLIWFSPYWWRRLFSVHWIENQTISLTDFQSVVSEDGDLKFFPFLTQKSVISGSSANTYLDVGEITNGVVYFEQPDAWGACQPVNLAGYAKIYIRIYDAFGGKHHAHAMVRIVDIAEAKKYNPSFGESLNGLRKIPSVT
jgi:hypothetical protein